MVRCSIKSLFSVWASFNYAVEDGQLKKMGQAKMFPQSTHCPTRPLSHIVPAAEFLIRAWIVGLGCLQDMKPLTNHKPRTAHGYCGVKRWALGERGNLEQVVPAFAALDGALWEDACTIADRNSSRDGPPSQRRQCTI